MTSQLDLDQGGTYREWKPAWLGPSVGWVWMPNRNVLIVTAGGTTTLDPSVSLVEVSVASLVTIILPSAIDPVVPPVALPGRFAKTPISIVDIGGNANTFAITIQPASGAENILGLSSIQITSNFAGYILYPSNTLKGWTNQS